MNYPSIKEYKEAILFAEDNFDQLKNLRPVLEDDGSPVMTSGNFAVVFKMKDEQTGKLYAVKCFLREQKGRSEAYRMIADELEYVSSTFLTPIKYLDKELFVDTNAGDETEFPVLLMDWVEGETLDKYIRKHLDDQYELSLLAYQFSRLAMWLMPQSFAHGDLKPDNILVKSDGTLVLVDYDGMYVPAMKGQKARELGSPDFCHPSRTETDFDEHIDDFSLASILLSLKAISLQPSLLEEYGAQDRLLFSANDYRNLSESEALNALRPLMQDAELASLYSLFILAASQNNLSGVSFRLFSLKRPIVSIVLSSDKNNVNQSDNKIIKKELLASFRGKKNVTHIVASNGSESYLTQERSFSDEAYAKGACKLNTVENDTKHVLFLFNDRDAEVGRYYLGKKLQGLTPKQLTEIKHELCFFESWNPETKTWVPCVGKVKETDEDKEYLDKYGKTKSEYLKENYNEVNTLTAVCLKKVFDFHHHYDYPELEVGKTYKVTHIGVFRSFTRIMLSGFGNKEYNSVCFEIFENGESINKKYTRDPRFEAPYLREKYHPGLLSNDSIEEENLSTKVTDDDLACAWTDEFGVMYSADRKRLLKAPSDLKVYVIRDTTKIICSEAFAEIDRKDVWNPTFWGYGNYGTIKECKGSQLLSVIIPDSVMSIGESAFSGCYFLKSILIPEGVKNIGYRAFKDCRSIINVIIPDSIKKIEEYAFMGCHNLETIYIPDNIEEIGNSVFRGCDKLTSIFIPQGTKKKFEKLLMHYNDKLVEKESERCLAYCSEDSQACEDKEYASWLPHTKIIKKKGKLGVVIDDGNTKKQIIPFNYDTWFDYDGYETDIRENFFDNYQDYIGYFAIRNADGTFTIHGYDKDGNLSQSFICEEFSPDSYRLNGKVYLRHPADGVEYDDIRRMRMDCNWGSDTSYIALHIGNKWALKSDDLKTTYIDFYECDELEKLYWSPKGYLIEIRKEGKTQICLWKKNSGTLILPNLYDSISLRYFTTPKYDIIGACLVLKKCDTLAVCSNELQNISPFIFSKVGSMINDNEVKVTRKVNGKEYEFVYRIVNSNGWRYNGTRLFNPDEVAAVKRTEVVASQYGNSLCIFMQSGGQTYIPLSQYSSLTVGDTIDMKTAKLITLCREGDDDIYRVIE